VVEHLASKGKAEFKSQYRKKKESKAYKTEGLGQSSVTGHMLSMPEAWVSPQPHKDPSIK
jgi:hypothetical protein